MKDIINRLQDVAQDLYDEQILAIQESDISRAEATGRAADQVSACIEELERYL